jgi:hypothetical protein
VKEGVAILDVVYLGEVLDFVMVVGYETLGHLGEALGPL